ncbi:MAG: BlaI/MecI/CopY family transcriptional regulator, partial [Oscillospiraceae bacterium]|nr:BlaI/MecI/CopY family transcriptional regulator [Oscillospiraceae bacterium]
MTGEKQRLTNTEWEVCECLWEQAPMTMTQIASRLTERTGWTRSTGETLVRRMADKGLLRWEQGKKAKFYYPTVAREDAVAQETKGFLRKVFGGSVGLLVNTMAEREELSREEIDQLYETLRK